MGFPVKIEGENEVIYVTKESDGGEGDVLIDVDGNRYVKGDELGEVRRWSDEDEAALTEAEDGLDDERIEATGHEPQKAESLAQEEAILHAETLAEQGGLDTSDRGAVRVNAAEEGADADGEAIADEAVSDRAAELAGDDEA